MDWNYVNTLLSVIHQASAAGPKFAQITSQATEELMNYMAAPAPIEEDDADE